MKEYCSFVITISANAEWEVVKRYFQDPEIFASPFGEWFSQYYPLLPKETEKVIFIHGGWGKVSSAASTQYLLDRWHPQLLINLGTCGGIEGEVERGEIILVEKTVIYDIYEQMGDPSEHLKHYETEIDNTWIGEHAPMYLKRSSIISADRDLLISDIPELRAKYSAIAGDWESGSIAWVAQRNNTNILILRGVTDLVGLKGGEAYNGNISIFLSNTELVMKTLLESLSKWLILFSQNYHK